MTAPGVRREKAALFSGCKAHPATAPAGSSRGSYGGDEIAEAFGERVTNWWQRECAGRKLRPLGISTLRDRVCMTAALLVLDPIFEADLPSEQYA
jgi:hypothetical protein